MHGHIQKLYNISNKAERLMIGLMSGTSLDGLDIALCKISGSGLNTKCELMAFVTKEFCDVYRQEVRKIFAKQSGSIQQLCLLNPYIARYHAKLVNQAIKEFAYKNDQIDIIASHGQTVYHCPIQQHGLKAFPNATLQLGDGDHIAVLTGITTLSDFRQKHIADGGEGAPLVMYGDYLLFQSKQEHRIMLNIGGIANLSVLPKNGGSEQVMSTDVGPGNTMMDAYIQKHFAPLQYDADAAIAKRGTINFALLDALRSGNTSASDFFANDFPKTTGPEVFNLEYLDKAKDVSLIQDISHLDIMATLCEFSATCISEAIAIVAAKHCKPELQEATEDDITKPDLAIYVSGGGIHNPLLLSRIAYHLQKSNIIATIKNTASLGINPDAKEAVLFALLANETLCSTGTTFSDGMPNVTMGKISFAD